MATSSHQIWFYAKPCSGRLRSPVSLAARVRSSRRARMRRRGSRSASRPPFGAGGEADIRCSLLSSCDVVRGGSWLGEGGAFVVVLAGGQAVVQAAEEQPEQVALRGGVPVPIGFAPVVAGAGAG
jgi:hypothetical protein